MEKPGVNNWMHAVYLSVMNELTLTRASKVFSKGEAVKPMVRGHGRNGGR